MNKMLVYFNSKTLKRVQGDKKFSHTERSEVSVLRRSANKYCQNYILLSLQNIVSQKTKIISLQTFQSLKIIKE